MKSLSNSMNLTPKERVTVALRGEQPDRPLFCPACGGQSAGNYRYGSVVI